MREEIKKFIENSYNLRKDKKYIRDYLYNKCTDIELKEALDYFDKLSTKKERRGIIYFLAVIFSLIKIFFLYVLFLFYRFLFFIKSLFSKKSIESINFEEFKKEASFSNNFLKIKNFFSKENLVKRKKIIIISLVIIIFLAVLIYSNFLYYLKCPNETCLKERIEKCDRAYFESTDFIPLKIWITGRSYNSCNSKVMFIDEKNNKKISMTCSLPPNYKAMPYSNLEFCSGPLREFIQEKIITEMQKIIGENIPELNSFFKN